MKANRDYQISFAPMRKIMFPFLNSSENSSDNDTMGEESTPLPQALLEWIMQMVERLGDVFRKDD